MKYKSIIPFVSGNEAHNLAQEHYAVEHDRQPDRQTYAWRVDNDDDDDDDDNNNNNNNNKIY